MGKFDKNTLSDSVSVVFTILSQYMAIVTLTFNQSDRAGLRVISFLKTSGVTCVILIYVQLTVSSL